MAVLAADSEREPTNTATATNSGDLEEGADGETEILRKAAHDGVTSNTPQWLPGFARFRAARTEFSETLTVAFEVERDVVEAERLEDRCKCSGHFGSQRALQFLGRDFDAHPGRCGIEHGTGGKPRGANGFFRRPRRFLTFLDRYRSSVGDCAS